MKTVAVILALAVAAIHAKSTGAPSCSVALPKHNGIEAQKNVNADGVSTINMVVSNVQSGANQWTIMVTAPVAEKPLLGLRIKPTNVQGGTFTFADDSNYQAIEDNACATHKNNNKKVGPQVIFYNMPAGSSVKPEFEVILVESYDTFWKTVAVPTA